MLEYISFEVSPITRAERVRAAEPAIYENLSPEQREFVEFVLSRYIETGVEVLDRELLSGGGVYFKVGELNPERELNDVLASANRV